MTRSDVPGEEAVLGRLRRRDLPGVIDNAVSFASVEGEDPETSRTKRLLLAVLWISLATTSTNVVQMLSQGAPLAALTIGALIAVVLGVMVAMWIQPAAYPGVMHVLAGTTVLVSMALTVLYGGFLESGANAMWGFVAVLGAIVIFEDSRAVIWLGLFGAAMVVAAAVADRTEPTYVLPDPESQAIVNLLLILTFVFAVLFYYVRQRSNLLRQSDDLLRNIFPDEVVERLRTSSEMIADDLDSASILFADVAGFTPMSVGMSPAELVGLLNDVFSDFDDLVEARGLEKIKTIGDSYMVAAGVPVPREDHAHAICDLALAMMDHTRSRLFRGRRLTFRIGVNSGPVVAGVIGRKKFSYDLWGDSVNTASRMESSGIAGRIQISRATRALVDDYFRCEPGGTVDIKGKGPMEIWYLEGRRDPQ